MQMNESLFTAPLSTGGRSECGHFPNYAGDASIFIEQDALPADGEPLNAENATPGH